MKTDIQRMLACMLVLTVVCAFTPPVSADPYLGGDPLVTGNGTSGTVSGGLWFDAYPGFDYAHTAPIVKNFTLPCSSGNVAWARLYVDTYIGNMQANYPLNTTVEFDGGSGYETLGTEIVNTTYTFPRGSGEDGTIWINDHCNRVTSDCLMWYDVTADINSSSVSARVQTHKPDGTQPFDGRVKMITLVVAYNDGDFDQIHYWVNQGHAAAALCHLVNDDGAGYGISAAAAVLFGNMNASQSGFANFFMQVKIKPIFIHPFVARFNFLFSEFSHHVADHLLLFCEIDKH